MKSIIQVCIALLVMFKLQAQQLNISGTITDSSGYPLPGVNIIIKGTSIGTHSHFDGKYTILARKGDVLIFSFVGMKTTQIKIRKSKEYNIIMKDDMSALNEVVITGYSTTTRTKSNIGSMRVKSKKLENRPNASFVQTLSGQVPGLNVAKSSGHPGANSLVQ